ncbi:hypothetical protein [Candidatus Protochlamydia phocaeensis]|uniref:hypothetical protein n=1 Tax=Candidatus Protochlamydia phocaeensis TaxID=1414722 RepID=UPI000839969C|nr:hypothetical protein [Candidatus Protochlamydia phocaeensis]
MAKADEKYLGPWISIQDPVNRMEASFPYQPIEMTFDLPLQNTPPIGHLHVFSSSTKSAVFILSALSLPTINEDILQGEAFKKNFEHYLVPRLFYSPHFFYQNQSFSFEKTSFKNQPALLFGFSYLDHQTPRLLKGLAVVKGHTLYSIFSLASEAHFTEEDLQQFIESFRLLSDQKL